MATIFLSVRVALDDVDEMLDVASGLGYEARPIGGRRGSTLVLFETMTVDEATGEGAAEQQVRERVAAALAEHDIEHEVIGSGADASSITKSLFTIRPIGATDETNTLEIRADNRAEFEQRLAAVRSLFSREPWPSQDLVGYEVTVEGLAAGDPDVQRPPFLPKRR
ncbi:hypothetical protein CSX12_13075 [Microbacterium sp. Y-01]|uniref:hypothetical protein n=1 Tax=Microbacterium sp. Y-01 TaxID=2048898 RepID=UPI000F5E1A2F|nr:hypothetical protein [Microbacterium sp. Y-01]AZH79309.1 hypothetical protein CSX12_13075 [Microbacterium sp. Y-01]